MSRSSLIFTALILAALTTSGCTDLRRALGIEKAPPDEFAVTAVAPLTLPPDYGLRPPHTLGGRPATPAPAQEARTNVFSLRGQPLIVNGLATPGEDAFLAHAQATKPDPHIREALEAEINKETDASDGFIDSLLFWKGPAKPDDAAVNPEKEADRLKVAGIPAPHVERTDHSENDDDEDN